MNKDAMRKEFETYQLRIGVDSKALSRHRSGYVYLETTRDWNLWCASAKAALSQQQAGEDELAKALEGIIEFLSFRSCPDETEKEVNEKYRLLDAAHQAIASHRARKGTA